LMLATNMLDSMSETDLHPCAKFPPNLLSSFRGEVTDRQTDGQTDSKLDIPLVCYINMDEILIVLFTVVVD